MTDSEEMRVRLMVEAAERAISNHAPAKGRASDWDALRAAILLLKRDCPELA